MGPSCWERRKGNFTPQNDRREYSFIPGDGKALVQLEGPGHSVLLAASQNSGPLKIFRQQDIGRDSAVRSVDRLAPNDRDLWITLTNGRTRKQECYYGASFLSQSARLVSVNPSMLTITAENGKGEKRILLKKISH